jgi:tetratricopeptide (TPR) repeat protein
MAANRLPSKCFSAMRNSDGFSAQRGGVQQIATGISALGLLSILLLSPLVPQAQAEPSYQARVLYERGAHALRGGDSEAALAFLEQAVTESPDFDDALALYGRALLIDGQDEKAADVLARLKKDGAGQDSDFYLGIASYRQGDWEDAVRYLSAARKERPESGQLHLYLGIAHQELGQNDLALASLTRAAELDPSLQGPVEYRLGVMALKTSPDEARQHFERVEEVAPGSALAASAATIINQIDSGYFRSWGLAATLGGGYDSNVSLATGEFQGLSGIESGVGTALLSGRATLLDRDKLVIDSGGGGYIQYHGGAPANAFDQVITQAWLRGTTPVTSELELSATYEFQYVWADYSAFRLTNSGDLLLRYDPKGKPLSTHAFYHIEGRDYKVPITPAFVPILNRDGLVQRAGLEQYTYLGDWFGWGANFVMVGFRYRREDSDGTEWSSNGYQPNITIGVPLPYRALWTTFFGYEWRNFDNPSCFGTGSMLSDCSAIPDPTGPKRKDEIIELLTEIRVPLTGQLDGAARYRYWNRNSNVPFYSYDRNLVQLLVTYRY